MTTNTHTNNILPATARGSHTLFKTLIAFATALILMITLVPVTSASAASKKMSVSLSVASKTYGGAVNGAKPIKFSGKVKTSGKIKSGKVTIYRMRPEGSSGPWVKVTSAKVSKSGKYSATVKKPVAGYQRYRAVATAKAKTKAVGSTRVVRTAYCPKISTTSFKSKPIRADFNKSSKSSPLTSAMIRGICGAKPKTTMRVVMWMMKITDGSEKAKRTDVQKIIAAIDYVQALRGVHTTVVYDNVQSGMKTGSLTYRWFKSMPHVSLKKCYGSCGSTVNKLTQEINHEKLFQINSTYYKVPGYAKGGAPLVMIPSDNLSSRQLHDYRQDMLTVVGDKKLSSNVAARVNFMVRCANTKGGKSCPNGAKVEGGVKISKKNSRYVLPANNLETAGSQGTAISFSPFPMGKDPLFDRLNTYRCNSSHKTIRIAMFQVQGAYVGMLQNAVRGLEARGCNVAVKVSNLASGSFGSDPALKSAMSSTGTPLQCVNMIHNKFVYADAYYNGKPEKTVITGARNFLDAAAWTNDEDMLRITATSSSPSNSTYRKAINAAAKSYLSMWNSLTPTTCKFL